MKPNFCLVALDETRHYNLGDDAKHIKQILNTYVYDQHEYTYCCEITPSHYLEPVYTAIVFADDISDDLRDELQDRYGYEQSSEGFYMHVRSVRSYVAKHTDRHHVYGEAESLDDAREFYQGNCVL